MSGIFFISWPLWFQKEIFEMFWEMAWSFEEWVVALRDGILPGIGRFCWRRPLFIPLKKFMFISVKKYISFSVNKYIFILLKKCIFIPFKNVFWNIYPTRRHFFPFCNSRYCCTLRFLSFALCKGQGISEYFETIYGGGGGDKQGKWPSGQLAGKARRRHPTDLAQSTTCLQGWEETWPIEMFFWKWGSHHWVAEPSCVQKNQQSEEKDEKAIWPFPRFQNNFDS